MELVFSVPNEHKSSIFIENGILNNLLNYKRQFVKYKKALIITDEQISKIYESHILKEISALGIKAHIYVIAPDEKERNLDNVEIILGKLSEYNLAKTDCLIALGGSTISDLCRMASSMYIGGIDLVLFPTTLASQVDNSIGYEYFINMGEIRNILCVNKLPRYVFIDPSLLRTAQEKSFDEGMVFIIKYALILDKTLFERLERMSVQEVREHIDIIITKSINDKIKILRNDQFGKNLSHIMALGNGVSNFIHLECENNGEKIKRANAFAKGMYFSALKSDKLNGNDKIAPRVKELFEKFNMDVSIPKFSREELAQWLEADKYIHHDYITMILLKDIGKIYTKRINKQDFASFWFE